MAARSNSSRACSGRCGHQLRFPFTCACDELCAQFSDCCEDYARACAPQQISALHAAHTSTLFTCLGSDTLLIGPLCIAYYPTFYYLCYRYRYTECLHEPVLDPTKYLMGAGPSTPRYFVSSCPPGYSATAPEALLCELHVLRPAINTSNHILFKVEMSTVECDHLTGRSDIQNSYCLSCWENSPAGLQLLTAAGIQDRSCVAQVSCDWWRAGHVTPVLTSDWSSWPPAPSPPTGWPPPPAPSSCRP